MLNIYTQRHISRQTEVYPDRNSFKEGPVDGARGQAWGLGASRSDARSGALQPCREPVLSAGGVQHSPPSHTKGGVQVRAKNVFITLDS